MIFTAFLEICTFLLSLLFELLPDVPDFANEFLESLNQFVDLIFSNLNLLGFFISIDMIKAIIPLLIIAMNFEHIYHFFFWVIEKIPNLNVKK